MIDIIYNGRVPACGVFCGGCPNYTRIKKLCKGAEYRKNVNGVKPFICVVRKKVLPIVSNAGFFHVVNLSYLPNDGSNMDRILLKTNVLSH